MRIAKTKNKTVTHKVGLQGQAAHLFKPYSHGFRFRIEFLFVLVFLIQLQSFALQLSNRSTPKDSTLPTNFEMKFDSIFGTGLELLYSKPDSARYYAQQALQIDGIENTNYQVRALNLLGASYNIESNFTLALDIYQQALEIAIELDDTLRISNLYNNLGIANLKIRNFNEALEFLLKAQHYYEIINDEDSKSSTINNIGLLYMEINNYDKALSYFRQAHDYALKRQDSLSISNSLTNFGVLYSNTGETDSAFKYMDKSIALNAKIDNQYGLTVVYIAKANVYNSLRDYENARALFYESLKVARKLNHSYQIATAIFGLASACLKLNELDESLQYAKNAMQIAEKGQHEKIIADVHSILAEVYEKMGNHENGLYHFRKHVELENEMINQNKLHQIYNLEIDHLNQAKEIQQLEIQRQELTISKKNNVILFIIFAFGLIIGGVYLLYLNQNHRREALHQKAITSLTEKKSRAAIEAEIQERQRIGQELHDGLGQMLSVARLSISAMQQKAFLTEQRKNELLDAAIESVDKAFYELRDISHNLAPSALSEKGLLGALKDLTDQVNKSNHIKAHFETYGMNGALDPIMENTLYRAVQELLNNAIKHANAKGFFIQLVRSEKEITLMVEDNGRGFSKENTFILPGGGLNNIRSRVENLDGNIFIDAMENRGTIITIVIPIKKTKHVTQAYTGSGN
jgi:two-component system, NarL family, sensor kinase